MRNVIKTIALTGVSLLFAGQVFAGSLTAQIEQPKSPMGSNGSVDINIVTLDIQGRAVTVQCYKKSPSDGGFSTLGSSITLNPNGGNNTANCPASSIFSGDGVYQFYASVVAGSDSVTTNTVSVDYETSGPGTPTNYSKNESGSCTFQLSFHTANDSGKTSKVNVYRGDSPTFTLNGGSLIGTVNIGSNLDGSFTNTPPDCAHTYYYELRAFDSYGNASGVVGDSIVLTTGATGATGTTSTTGASSGALGSAIPAGSNGNVLGEATGPTGLVTSTPTATPTIPYTPPSPKSSSKKTIVIVAIALLLLVIAWAMRKKEKVV
jgi:hypothetical protein